MRNEELFEALSELDEELVAKAKHIDTYGEQTIIISRTPLWRIITGFAAAAACVAALVVGGIFGVKYVNGKSAVTPPASGADGDTITSKSECMAYAPAEYPPEAKYVYEGDYGELDYADNIEGDRDIYPDYDALAEISDLIVSGEFTDHAHQTAPVDGEYDIDNHWSYNTFYIEKVIKGDKKTGDAIAIAQQSVVHQGKIYSCFISPMICGDRWVYFLEERDGYYYPVSDAQGRYPLPGSRNKELKDCGVNGYYSTAPETMKISYKVEEMFEYTVSENFGGVELTVKMLNDSFVPGTDIWVKATVRNTTDKAIELYIPRGQVGAISLRVAHGEHCLYDLTEPSTGSNSVTMHTLKPGEEYVKEMRYDTTNLSAEHQGEYKGTATIRLISDPDNTGVETTEHIVEFALNISEKAKAETVNKYVTKVYEWMASAAGNNKPVWTMDEFPDVKFSCDGGTVTVLTNDVVPCCDNEREPDWELHGYRILYGGMPIENVYLADLNGDGKREIISATYLGSGIIDGRIEAYDLANDVHYTLSDRMNYDYSLKEESSLIVEKRKYMESDVISSQTLSLDMMDKTMIENPVTFISEESSAGWVMEEFPNVKFSTHIMDVSATVNGVTTALYEGVFVDNVRLCDLNGDGKREIISQFRKDINGSHGIRAYDYANGVCYVLWEDYMDYLLSYYDRLFVNVYSSGGEYIFEHELTNLDDMNIIARADKTGALISATDDE